MEFIMDNKIKIGDMVYFLDAKGGGKVLSINKKEVLVLTDEGFEETHSIATIFKRNNQNNKRLINAFVPNNIKKQSVKTKDKSIFKNKSQLVWEIDVHIENIVEHFYHLSNYEIINLQLEVCEEIILKAQRMKIRKLIIIHGKGQGVLRNEIHQMLYSFNLDFKDADYMRYSGGATDIFFR